jgi:cell division GTPase FtsZ
VSEVLNPVEIEAAIRECAKRIHNGVKVVTDAEYEAREKRYASEEATTGERKEAEVAEIAFRYAERTARAVEAELRAWQSVGASVRTMYGAQQ